MFSNGFRVRSGTVTLDTGTTLQVNGTTNISNATFTGTLTCGDLIVSGDARIGDLIVSGDGQFRRLFATSDLSVAAGIYFSGDLIQYDDPGAAAWLCRLMLNTGQHSTTGYFESNVVSVFSKYTEFQATAVFTAPKISFSNDTASVVIGTDPTGTGAFLDIYGSLSVIMTAFLPLIDVGRLRIRADGGYALPAGVTGRFICDAEATFTNTGNVIQLGNLTTYKGYIGNSCVAVWTATVSGNEISAGVYSYIPFTGAAATGLTTLTDTSYTGAMNAKSGFTIPKTGLYLIGANVDFRGLTGHLVMQNTTSAAITTNPCIVQSFGGSFTVAHGQKPVFCNAGDLIKPGCFLSTSGSIGNQNGAGAGRDLDAMMFWCLWMGNNV